MSNPMMMPFDRQLWRLLHERELGIYTVLLWYLLPAVVLGFSIWFVVERRSRSIWRRTTVTRVIGGAGPYRAGAVPTPLERAPLSVRLTALAGVVLSMVGLVWPVLLATDLTGPALFAATIETVCALSAGLALLSAFLLLRHRDDELTRRKAFAVRVVAFLLFGLSVAYHLHVFDGLQVEARGIKWRETMPFDAFLRTGWGPSVGGHTGTGWRVLLGAAASFGLLSAGYFALMAHMVTTRTK
jgi:hypothetical protein